MRPNEGTDERRQYAPVNVRYGQTQDVTELMRIHDDGIAPRYRPGPWR